MHEREPDPGTNGPHALVAGVQHPFLKSNPEFIVGQPRPAVSDLEDGQHPVPVEKAENDGCPRRRNPHGVGRQPVNDLPNPPRISLDPHGVSGTLQPQLDPDGGTPTLPNLRSLSEQSGQIDRNKIKPKVVRPKPRKVKKVGDQPIKPMGLPHHGPPNIGDLVPGDDPVGKRLGKPAHRGQGSPQLVGDRKKKLPLPSLTEGEGVSKRIERLPNLNKLPRPFRGHAQVPPPMTHPDRDLGGPPQGPSKQPSKQQPSNDGHEHPNSKGDEHVPDETPPNTGVLGLPHQRHGAPVPKAPPLNKQNGPPNGRTPMKRPV